MSCFHPMPAVKGACSNGAQERNKGRFRHVALGQSSCVPPGRNHMSSGAGKQSKRSCVQCMCVRMVCAVCVQFVHSATTEEDGRTCVGVWEDLNEHNLDGGAEPKEQLRVRRRSSPSFICCDAT